MLPSIPQGRCAQHTVAPVPPLHHLCCHHSHHCCCYPSPLCPKMCGAAAGHHCQHLAARSTGGEGWEGLFNGTSCYSWDKYGQAWADLLCVTNFNLQLCSSEVWEVLLQITYQVCAHKKNPNKPNPK